jgi:hypothetical protein
VAGTTNTRTASIATATTPAIHLWIRICAPLHVMRSDLAAIDEAVATRVEDIDPCGRPTVRIP